jgi:hypothetical protein
MAKQVQIAAQDQGLAKRGLFLLSIMLLLTTAVAFIALRPRGSETAPAQSRAELVALAVATPVASFPGNPNWAALGLLAGEMPSSPGWGVRYNAVIALCRTGSEKLPLDVVAEMLDENQQLRNFRVPLKDGALAVDEQAAYGSILQTMAALAKWHQNAAAVQAVSPNNPELLRVYSAIDKLAQSNNPVLRDAAKEFLKMRQAGTWQK